MNIAVLGYGYHVDPSVIGGTQSYLKRLAEHTSDKGHTMDVFVYGDSSKYSRIDIKPFREVFYVQNISEISRIIKSKGHYDALIITNFPPRLFFHQFPLLFISRKYCDSICWLSIVRSNHRLIRYLKGIICRLFYDYVIAASYRLCNEHKMFGSKTYLALPPVPLSFFRFDRDVTSDEKLTVAYIGRISDDKGTDSLIAAFEETKIKFANVEVEVYGYHDNNSDSSKQLHEKLLSSKHIHYFPEARAASAQSDEYVAGLMSEIDVLVLPYKELSGKTVDIPLILLEALASGCVVISTKVGDVPRIISDKQLLMTKDNDLSNILASLVDKKTFDKKRREQSENIRLLSVSQPKVGDNFIEILQLHMKREPECQK